MRLNILDNNLNQYDNPLNSKYASKEMHKVFSSKNKYVIWRELWLSLAKAEKEVGLNITEEQIIEMENNLENIDFEVVKKIEDKVHHEVMAHIKAFSKVAPLSAPIIHLGETSAFVIDNADLIVSREALELVIKKLYKVISILSDFADKYKELETLAFTHLQVAQPTTVGKRASLWLSSLMLDFNEIVNVTSNLKLRGVKGTTGTAASFKGLLGNYNLLRQIDEYVANDFGFEDSYTVTSQTYDRKIDSLIGAALVQIAISSHKITNDLRILQNFREVSESFSSSQIGSSAMPYKRNPILSERISSLSKFVISLQSSTIMVASTQWLERTLDDSANKRLVLPQMFLAIDGILDLLIKVFSNITVYKDIINSNLQKELPFLLSEDILMKHVKNGGDRQEGHEKLRQHAVRAFNEMQLNNTSNRLLEYIIKDSFFKITKKEVEELLKHKNLSGFAKNQVESFLEQEVRPLLEDFEHLS